MTVALAPMDVGDRATRLRTTFAAAGCDALVVTNLTNVRYLTGFSGSAGLVLVLPDELVLITDGRYAVQAEEQLEASGVEARVEIGAVAKQKDIAAAAASGISRMGLEAASVTWARQRAFAAEWFPAAELVPTEGLVEGLRRVKDAGEVARIAEAARIADAALAEVRPLLEQGVTEVDFALALDFAMRRLGAEDVSFATIVASGLNGAKPHARPSDRRIAAGDRVVVDFGALVDGYHSDMTRTVAVGQASPPMTEIAAVVVASQRAGVDAVRAGVPAAHVDEACRAVIRDAGFGEAFVHGTGHGVGLDIHEAPAVAATSTDTLAAGHVVTVEPGIYLPELGGVRIEDTVVVTDDGCELLTHAPK